jgi:hypothetical protein
VRNLGSVGRITLDESIVVRRMIFFVSSFLSLLQYFVGVLSLTYVGYQRVCWAEERKEDEKERMLCSFLGCYTVRLWLEHWKLLWMERTPTLSVVVVDKVQQRANMGICKNGRRRRRCWISPLG